MAMQRDGHSDDRTKAGVSGRTPPVIEGEAVEVAAAGAPTPAIDESVESTAEAVTEERDTAQMTSETERDESAQPENGGPADAIAAPPPRKTRRGVLVAVLGFFVVAIAGAVAWLATPGQHGVSGDLRSRVVALLPESAQRALHLKSTLAADTEKLGSQAQAGKPGVANSEAAKPEAAKPEASASEAANPQVANPQVAKSESAKSESAKSESAKSEATATGAPRPEPAKQTATETKPSEGSTQQPAVTGEAKESIAPATGAQAPAAQTSAPQVAGAGAGAPSSVDPKRIEDMSVKIDGLQKTVDALQTKLDAALGRIDGLQSKLELAQGKLDLAPTADAVTQAAQRIETLTQRLAAIEQKFDQPKTDARAPQARENNAPSAREFAASRAVVAQATTEALRAGAPLGDDLAALKGLGVADEKIADLAPFAKAGAPTVAQLAQQWRGMRDKVLALEAPPPGASFTDKLVAKAKSVFRVTWAGQGQKNSIGATAARIDTALQRNDLATAVAACDDFPAVAKNLVEGWRTAAAARLKADATARALLSESISAIGRSSQ
ncbi:MAG: hypothetical protein KF904_03645 [Rhodoblastus sp.]|nr:hypothetical protein [Rhodoblastus sp.]